METWYVWNCYYKQIVHNIQHNFFNFFQWAFFQLKVDNEGQHFTKISSYGRHFVWLCLVYPSGDHIATLNASGCINTWAVRNGNLVCMELLL